MGITERGRHVEVFFYGLFMDEELLRGKGLEPEGGENRRHRRLRLPHRPTSSARSHAGCEGLCPSQAPQSAHREDDGDERGHAERDERPDEEEASAGLGDLAVMCPRHMEDGDKQPKQRPEDYYDVPRSPSGEHYRSVKPNDKDRH